MTTATASPRVQSVTPQDKLDLWLAGGNVPSVERFHPTPEEPIMKVQFGELNGLPLFAYGVRLYHPVIGYTGWLTKWQWHLDQDAALEQANFNLFYASEELAEWVGRFRPDQKDPATWVSRRRIEPKVGRSFDVCLLSDYPSLHRVGEVCTPLHGMLLEWSRKQFEELPVVASTVVPPIREEVIGTCPHCKSPVHRYGYMRYDSYASKLRLHWCGERGVAEQRRAETMESVLACQEYLRKEADRQALMDLAQAVHSIAYGVQEDALYRLHHKALDSSLLERFTTLYWNLQDRSERVRERHDESFPVDLISDLEKVTQEVETALQSRVAKIAEEVDRCGLVGKLRSLFDTCLKTCPLCRAPYQRDDEWIRKLLMEGSARVVCRCPDRYNVKENPPAPLPELTALREFLPRAESLLGHAVPIERIKVGAATVAEFLIGGDKYQGYHGVVAVDREALRVASAKVRSINVWPQTAILAYAAQIDHFEKRVAKGELLKLNLRYDHNRQTWSERRRVDGIVTIYTVAREHEAVLDGAGSYYCREFRRPASAQKPDFALVLVTPYMRVP